MDTVNKGYRFLSRGERTPNYNDMSTPKCGKHSFKNALAYHENLIITLNNDHKKCLVPARTVETVR